MEEKQVQGTTYDFSIVLKINYQAENG